MGLLIDGIWKDQWYNTKTTKGVFVREDAQFRNWITAEGQPQEDGKKGFPAEKNRYHLYVSYACPWAHRTLIFRKLKGLEDVIPYSFVKPNMLTNGWEFDGQHAPSHDPVNGVRFLYELYTLSEPAYSGRVTVPVLWDKKTSTIVSNESSEIIRMFNSAFNSITGNSEDYYPTLLREEIDCINEVVYHDVNNGVYRCGFATQQEAYEEAFQDLFDTLDWLDKHLRNRRYLTGNQQTEADWRLFTTLIRFDAVYYGHFKTNLRRIQDYPNLSQYLRDLYQHPGIKETVHLDHIKRHYYYSHETINPSRIVPEGPKLFFDEPHDRARLNFN